MDLLLFQINLSIQLINISDIIYNHACDSNNYIGTASSLLDLYEITCLISTFQKAGIEY